MNTYTATLSRSGNGYVLRIPKHVVEASGLKVGDKVKGPILEQQTETKEQNTEKIMELFAKLQELTKDGAGLGQIKDPVAWQREIRKDRSLPGRD